ncbi:11117_t:CDS:1, partial [Ambispora leptoticha]
MTSLLELNAITEPTWKRNELNSQINDIWTNTDIALDFTKSELIEASKITD